MKDQRPAVMTNSDGISITDAILIVEERSRIEKYCVGIPTLLFLLPF